MMTQRLVAGVDHLDRAHHDAAVRVEAWRGRRPPPRRRRGRATKALEVQAIARQRPDQIRAALARSRLQRVRALDVALLEMRVIFGGAMSSPLFETMRPSFKADIRRGGSAQRTRSRGRQSGKSKPATQRTVSSAASRARFSGSFSAASSRLRGDAIEAADAHVDRMDLAPAEQAHQVSLPVFFSSRPRSHDVGMVAGHFDRAGVAEEIRRVQHVDVQRVALDPLAAIEQPAQVADRASIS